MDQGLGSAAQPRGIGRHLNVLDVRGLTSSTEDLV
jgi:hypothetical protein